MTVRELKEKAKNMNLVGYSKLSKQELEEYIQVNELNCKEIQNDTLEKIIGSDVKIINSDNQDKWLEIRKSGIGGSDIGALLGVNKWKSTIDVYVDKVIGKSFTGNTFTHWGHMLESIVFKEFQNKHKNNMICYEVPYTMIKDNAVANVDGMILNTETKEYGVLEIKTTNAFNFKEWEGDTIPESYYAQVQHYLYVTGLKFAYIACLIGGNNYKEFYIERSEEDIEIIKNTINEFWNENILKEVPPMLDGTDAYSKYLLEQSKKSEESLTENDLQDIEMGQARLSFNLIKNKNQQIKDLEKDIELHKQYLMQILNDNGAKKLKIEEGTASIIVTSRKKVDKKLMEKENPELSADYKRIEELYTEKTESTFIKIS